MWQILPASILSRILDQIKTTIMSKFSFLASCLLFSITFLGGCHDAEDVKTIVHGTPVKTDAPEYFNLRPELEKAYGYTHAVRIGNDLKISGAVSMNDTGMIIGKNDMELQMKNCYSDLEKILKHYGYTYDDVVVENIYTTSMESFFKVAAYRNSIYKKQFPTGTWLEVKGLAVQDQLIEIDMEAHKERER
jgi:2-iminobutanoate/2-iminopropanoate deaminase